MVEPKQKLRVFLANKKHKFTIWKTLFVVDTKYVPINPLGKGSYGVVCSSLNNETNEKVAIKKINDVFESDVDALRTLREIIILRNVRHDNVIALKDVMVTGQKSTFKEVYLVYELMDTDLDRIIQSPQPITNEHCKYLVFQLLRGLRYLHSANILHRDLKPGNLLVNANCDLKICDFGLSRTSKGEGRFMTDYVVTRWYRAPELLLGSENYDASIDVWSVGCIFAEILGRKPIFPGSDCFDQLQRIINVLGSPCEVELNFIENERTYNYVKSLPYSDGCLLETLYPEADPGALDLLQQMLEFDPRRRITVTEALQHPYMRDLYLCIVDEPAADKPLDLDHIVADIGEAELRDLIWREMLCYHSPAAARSQR